MADAVPAIAQVQPRTRAFNTIKDQLCTLDLVVTQAQFKRGVVAEVASRPQVEVRLTIEARAARGSRDPVQPTPVPPVAAIDRVQGTDAQFHLAIAEASHNAVLLHTIRGLFDLLKRNVVTNIGGMYALRDETRDMLMSQHRELYEAIMARRAVEARDVIHRHINYVQEVLAEGQQEAQRLARAQRRQERVGASQKAG